LIFEILLEINQSFASFLACAQLKLWSHEGPYRTHMRPHCQLRGL